MANNKRIEYDELLKKTQAFAKAWKEWNSTPDIGWSDELIDTSHKLADYIGMSAFEDEEVFKI